MARLRVDTKAVRRAMDGMMTMFEWEEARRLGIVDENWCDVYSRLASLLGKVERGEFGNRVFICGPRNEEQAPMKLADYEKIAASLAKSWVTFGKSVESKVAVSNVINNLCVTLKEDNQNFSREKFIDRIEQLIAEDKASG